MQQENESGADLNEKNPGETPWWKGVIRELAVSGLGHRVGAKEGKP